MSKLYDRDGFCVFGTGAKATQLVVKDRVYLIVDRSSRQNDLNEVQRMHLKGEHDVHAKCVDWRAVTDKKGNSTGKGVVKVFPSIAQQWKNQMKGRYVKPTSYNTNTDPDKVGEEEYWKTIKFYAEKH